VIQKEGAWSEDLYQGEEDVSKLMTVPEIENLYRNLKLIRPETPQVKSISEKWKLLQELHQQHAAQAEEHERKNRPERYVKLLRSGKMNKIKWERLARNLAHTDWQADFMKEYGIESIMYCLTKLHLKFTSTVIEHTREDEIELSLMLLCIERAKGSKNLASKRSLRLLFQLLEYAGKKKQTDALLIINVLTHICRWDDIGMYEVFYVCARRCSPRFDERNFYWFKFAF